MRKLLIILFFSVLHAPTFGNNDEEAKQLAQLAQDYADKEDEVEIKKEKTSQQLMGKLPSYRVCPTPPFQKVSVDLVGHFLVKPTSRTQIKVWVLMYLCDVSKA